MVLSFETPIGKGSELYVSTRKKYFRGMFWEDIFNKLHNMSEFISLMLNLLNVSFKMIGS